MAHGGWGVCIVLENFKYLNPSAGGAQTQTPKHKTKTRELLLQQKKKKPKTGGE